MRQIFEAPEAASPLTSLAAVTGGTAEVNVYTPAQYSPIPANYATPGMQWMIDVMGLYTAPATTPGTLTVTPRIGTSGTPASNTTLGASTAVAVTTQTNVPFWVRGVLTCRTIGLPGANSTFIFTGMLTSPLLVAAGIGFGGTVATVDASIAQAFALSFTPSVTGQSFTVQHTSWRTD